MNWDVDDGEKEWTAGGMGCKSRESEGKAEAER